MLRRLTTDVGRFKAGILHDWPLTTWNHIAKEAGKPLDAISKPEDDREAVLGVRRQHAKSGERLPRRGSRT